MLPFVQLPCNIGWIKIFEAPAASRCVTDADLLLEVFLSEGKKAGLDPDILATVFDFLNDQRFISEGRRGHVRAELARLIKEHAEGT